MSIEVIFGSRSDETVFQSIIEELKKQGIKAELRILSAHRTPKELEKAVKESKAKLFIAGAGLSAALPGVIASQTVKPVIGVPCMGAYYGLDAFLSVHQMPPGIPVLGVGVNKGLAAVKEAKKILGEKKELVLLKTSESRGSEEVAGKAEKILKEFQAKYSVERKKELTGLDEKKVHICFLELMNLNLAQESNALIIYCPIAKPNLPEQAIELMNKCRTGLWVGIGRGENAALAALEITGGHQKKMSDYRKELAKKVLKENK